MRHTPNQWRIGVGKIVLISGADGFVRYLLFVRGSMIHLTSKGSGNSMVFEGCKNHEEAYSIRDNLLGNYKEHGPIRP
jgi:hypothetical protein